MKTRSFHKLWAMFVIATMIFSLFPTMLLTVSADSNTTTYYVDSVNGNDINNGTGTDSAWKTLEKVNNTTFQPSDRILFKAGCSWEGQLWPKGSGTDGSPIVIDMYGSGNKPLFNGHIQKFGNLVFNPGFETGDKFGWVVGGNYRVINNNQHTGSYCVEVGPDNSAEQIISGLTPNTQYTLKAWVKVGNSSSTAYMGVKDFGGHETAAVINNLSYTQVSVTFTTGASDTTAKIYLWRNSAGSGYAYGDDFEIEGGSSEFTNVGEVFKLRNQSYWEVNNLQITNWATDGISLYRRGVYVEAADIGTVRHIYFYNLDIHDINGGNPSHEYLDCYSGGIIMLVVDDPGTQDVQSKFDDVLVEGCNIRSVSKEGIFIRNFNRIRGGFTWENAPDSIGSYYPNTNVRIRNNSLDTIGGDGIVACECQAPLIEYNVAKDCHFDNEFWCVAIWSINCDDALIQYNEAYGTKTFDDGQGFDIDWNQRRTVMQYNYSHDNEGGFMLICCWYGDSFNTDGVVRYNISQNDRCRIFEIHGFVQNTQIYNNTIYVGHGLDTKIYNMDWWDALDGRYPSNISNNNNIFYNLGSGGYQFVREANTIFDFNCFYGNFTSSEPVDEHKITADPMLINPGSGQIGRNSTVGYKLQSNSPCIDSGIRILGNGGRDYWGNIVPYNNGQTDIGAHEYQGDGTSNPPAGSDKCTGGTITRSSDNGPDETAYKAFDDSISTKWLSIPNTGWIQYDFADVEAYAINRYTLTSANDVPARDPKNWNLKGSNDGLSWTTVDVRNNETFDSRNQTRTFSFNNMTPYQMFRLEITANSGDSNLQLAEIEMLEVVREDRCTAGAVVASSQNGPNETAVKAFDDNTQTKWYAFGKTPWIQYDFDGSSAYSINSYSITSANDEPERDPKNWTMKGSTDGIYWTVVDTRTNELFSSRGQTRTFSFSNTKAYTVYKLEITANNGAVDTQLAEVELFDQ